MVRRGWGIRKLLLSLAGFGFLLIGFQNCGNQFNLINSRSENLQSTFEQPIESTNQNSGIYKEKIDLLTADLRTKSCMFNGILGSNVEDRTEYLELLKRSNCKSLPRAIETWNSPPDFLKIKQDIIELKEFTQKSFNFGIFIGESIRFDIVGYTDLAGVPFDFKKMCKQGSEGFWGAQTCVPTTSSQEYIRYLNFVIEESLKIGVSDFLFGQADYQDNERKLSGIVAKFRNPTEYFQSPALFGVQPNTLPTENEINYLTSFDYIVTPLMVDSDVTEICAEGSTSSYCKVVWFHKDVLKYSRLVIAELDWNSVDDDIHRFAKKSEVDRSLYLQNQRKRLLSIGAGLIMPFRIILNGGSPNRNCFGFNEWVYSSNKKYGCKDEDNLNRILDDQSLVFPRSLEFNLDNNKFQLKTNQYVESSKLKLVLQEDGNLVLYEKESGQPYWSSQKSGLNCQIEDCRVEFSANGSIVQSRNSIPYWESNSIGSKKFYLQEVEPYLRLENSSGQILWSSDL